MSLIQAYREKRMEQTYEYHSHAENSVLRSRDTVLRPECDVFDAAMRAESSA